MSFLQVSSVFTDFTDKSSVLDSGASTYMTGIEEFFHSFLNNNILNVNIIDGTSFTARGKKKLSILPLFRH